MKKLVVIIFALLLLMLPSCSNDNTPEVKVHIIAAGKDIKIQSDYVLFNSGAKVTLENGKRIFLSNGTYIIFRGKCPICESEAADNG